MPDEHYENPKPAAAYDLFSGWSPDLDFCLSLAGEPPQHVEVLSRVGDRVTFEQRYQFPDETMGPAPQRR